MALPSAQEALTDVPSSYSEVVQVVVGRGLQAVTFHVHKDLLSTSSPFFKAALREHWIEGKMCKIQMPEDKPDDFKYYLDFLYLKALNHPLPQQISSLQELLDDLCKTYVLGDKLQDDEFCDMIMRAMLLVQLNGSLAADKTIKIPVFSRSAIRWIWTNTAGNSPLRKLVLSQRVAYHFCDVPKGRPFIGKDMPGDYLSEVAAALTFDKEKFLSVSLESMDQFMRKPKAVESAAAPTSILASSSTDKFSTHE